MLVLFHTLSLPRMMVCLCVVLSSSTPSTYLLEDEEASFMEEVDYSAESGDEPDNDPNTADPHDNHLSDSESNNYRDSLT